MPRKTRFFFHLLRTLVCLVILSMAGGASVFAQDDDAMSPPSAFQEKPAAAESPKTEAPKAKPHKKKKKKSTARAAKTAEPSKPVNSGELMSAMRQSLQSPMPQPPIATAPPVPPPPPPPVRVVTPQPMTPPVVAAKEITSSPPPAPEPEKPAAPPAKEQILTPAPAETPPPTPAPAPASAPMTGGAPLLSEMQEAPTVLGSPSEEAAPTVQGATETPNYAPPRPLFSKKGGGKRAGVIQKSVANREKLPPVASTENTPPPPPPEPESAVAVMESSSAFPNTASGGTHTAPPPSALEGAVVYTQHPGENPPPIAAPPPPPPPVATPPASDEVISAPPPPPAEPVLPPAASVSPPPPEPMPAATTSSSVLHASCGAANGIGSPTKPTGDLCTQGIPSEVLGNGPWRWSCKGEKGGASVKCAAPLLVNGECGLANGSQSASAPLRKQLCASGKSSDVSGNGPWYWNCFGDNGGVVAQCAAYTLVSGACGPAANIATNAAPAAGLCASGKQTPVVGNGPWSWSCVGSGEGTTVNCTAPMRHDGVCGTASGMGTSERPAENLCASGIPSKVAGNGPWHWNCSGDNGGLSANCSAPVALNAACGPAHGIGTATKPAQGLCATGQASDISGDGPWMWTCYGNNGGARVNCMAPRKMDGVCGPSNHLEFDNAPDRDLCASGAAGAVIGSGPWQWTCQGAGGGVTVNCIADRATQSACGPAHGIGSPVPPSSGLCAAGTPTSVTGSGPWTWSCEGAHGGHAVNCMAPILVNGACGAAAEAPAPGMPASNLCRAGTPSAVSGNGPWMWTCAGAGGGVSASCRALMQEAAEVPPPPPPPPPSASASPVAEVPPATAMAGNECVPNVRRWTITCQQGGYPANYAGVIVGETQTLCPTGVERGVWLSNSCAPSTNSSPVSPSPGVLLHPAPPEIGETEMLPPIAPAPVKGLRSPRLATPRFKGAAVNSSIRFAPRSDGLDSAATRALDDIVIQMQRDDKSLITLNAYAAMPSSNDQQEAQRLSLARALAVRSYLMSRGVSNSRIDVRALGPAGDALGDDRVDLNITP